MLDYFVGEVDEVEAFGGGGFLEAGEPEVGGAVCMAAGNESRVSIAGLPCEGDKFGEGRGWMVTGGT